MPIQYLRRLTGKHRSPDANRHLGFMLAFVAGAINAGGFLAIHQYTSNMTGHVSSMADDIALERYALALTGLGVLLSFMAGAACCAIMVNYARRRHLHSEYALPLLLEAALLLCFGLLGAKIAQIDGSHLSMIAMLLGFIMGLQNAVITKISKAEIRTTHVTGLVTDIGIELGKLAYWNRHAHPGEAPVQANFERLALFSRLVISFFSGGVLGAWGFKHLGYLSTLPLALLLVLLVITPVSDDIRARLRRETV
ncbi:MAG: DUF1275 domain-containing protein [Sterolibacterium sp.]|jgi:uncharacterized membrane protein YoaK (UPF0700 family)|nr:DUF1275 domain-containing protein [Sterolibacterium sp.]